MSEWAAALGLPRTTAWRFLRRAIAQRMKLDKAEEKAYWLQTQQRAHGTSLYPYHMKIGTAMLHGALRAATGAWELNLCRWSSAAKWPCLGTRTATHIRRRPSTVCLNKSSCTLLLRAGPGKVFHPYQA